MIISKDRFAELWNALVEQPLEAWAPHSPLEISNGVSAHLADYLTNCGDGNDECLADLITED